MFSEAESEMTADTAKPESHSYGESHRIDQTWKKFSGISGFLQFDWASLQELPC